ncbi:MAG TPA: monofunctional biosynthetic peptidoglycan transglycosylase [Candidatus Kryptonia bacterium]
MPAEIRTRHVVRNSAALIVLVLLVVEAVMLPFPWTVAKLKMSNPKSTALMDERIKDAKTNHEPFFIRHTFVPLSQISPSLIHAVIVAEDGTFFEHNGVDWYEVKESLEKNWEEKRIVRGSSTITMQLAKNLWFSTSRDPLTKMNEVIAAYMLEHYLTKDRILELYLNEIEFGRGIFGVESASKVYFGTSASQVTREECLRLAAIIPSPIRHDPNTDSRFVSNRLEIISLRMEARGW